MKALFDVFSRLLKIQSIFARSWDYGVLRLILANEYRSLAYPFLPCRMFVGVFLSNRLTNVGGSCCEITHFLQGVCVL
jgi:hypothetical protein